MNGLPSTEMKLKIRMAGQLLMLGLYGTKIVSRQHNYLGLNLGLKQNIYEYINL